MQKRRNKLVDASSKMVVGTGIASITMNSVHVNSVHKAGLTIYESLLLGTQKSVFVRINGGSEISGLFLKEMYELFVGANKTVCNIGVSVLSKCPQRGFPLYSFIHLGEERHCCE